MKKSIFLMIVMSSFMASCQNKENKQEQNEAKAETSITASSLSELFHTEQIVLVISPNESSISAQMQLLNWNKEEKNGQVR